VLVAAILWLCSPVEAGAGEALAGPVRAEVLEVIDGDTIRVGAHIWLGQRVTTLVRLSGIDAPELKADCAEERRLAELARRLLRDRLGEGDVWLTDIEYEKFAGRVLARVATADGSDLSHGLLQAGLARPYDGGKRASWCPPLAAASERVELP
jgi:endonuclease YncB( thermonuclease family)